MAKKNKTLKLPEIEGLSVNPRETERRVLSSLVYGDSREKILTMNEDSFTHEDFKCVFRVIREMNNQHKPIDDLVGILNELKGDRVTLLTLEKIERERLGESWNGGQKELEDAVNKVFQEILKRDNFQDSGLIINDISYLEKSYISNVGKKTAIALSNIENLSSSELNGYLSMFSEELSRATSSNNASVFENTTKERIRKRREKNLEGIGTNYYVFDDSGRCEITIPRGTITLVCGLPGHCKSTMLLNIALRFAKTKQEEGNIIYWTFEESEERTATKVESLYHGENLSKPHVFGGNVHRLREYYKGNTSRINNLPELEKSLTECEEMETSGRFKIISKGMTSLDFLSSLRSHILNTGEKIGAIFIDYIQMVKSGRNMETRLDIAESVNDFLVFAKETNIPIIAAAQLNREAKCPQMMGGRHIAESSDLTRFADTILCLWNPLKETDISLTQAEFDKWKSKEWYYNHMTKFDCEIGKGGKLYLKVDKARDIQSGADAVYTYDGDINAIGRTPKMLEADSKDSEDLPSGNDDKGNPDNWKTMSNLIEQDEVETLQTKTRKPIRKY